MEIPCINKVIVSYRIVEFINIYDTSLFPLSARFPSIEGPGDKFGTLTDLGFN